MSLIYISFVCAYVGLCWWGAVGPDWLHLIGTTLPESLVVLSWIVVIK